MAIDFPDSPSNGDTHTVGDKTWTWDGTTWTLVTGATADHGNLGGLADDDHTQYLLADGTRTATELTVSGDLTVDTNTLHVDSTNDRVGIGTTSPATQLQLSGTNGREALRLSGDGGGGGTTGSVYMGFHHWATGTNPSARIGVEENGAADYDGSLLFQTRNSNSDVVPSTRMVIDQDGNVGIGQTSPSYRLDVNGPEDTASRVNISSGNTAYRYHMRFSRNNILLANGIFSDTGATYFGNASDANLKTGISDLSKQDALAAVSSLRPVEYRYLLDTEDVVRKGFIAQEMVEVIPEAVHRVGGGHPATRLIYDENGDLVATDVDENGDPIIQQEPDWMMTWEPITTTLVAAFQAQQELIQELTARIEALESAP